MTMVCVTARFPMILSLMDRFLIRVSITPKDNRVFKALSVSTALLYFNRFSTESQLSS